MWIADMDFRAHESIIKAVTARAQSGLYGYADASPRLCELTVARLKNIYGADPDQVDSRWIHWLPGLIPGLNHAVKATVPKNGSVISHIPIYPPFLSAPLNQRRPLVSVPLLSTTEEGEGLQLRHSMDMDALEKAVRRPDVHLLLLCSPHNPTGRVWTRDELLRVAEMCVAHDVAICSDEVWGEMVLAPEETPFTSLLSLCADVPGLTERLIVLLSPSKVFNVAGLDLAYAVIPDEKLRRRFIRLGRDKAEVPHFGYDACEAAYGDAGAEAWRLRLAAYLHANRDFAISFLRRECPGLRVTVPEASYLLWIDANSMNTTTGETEAEAASPAASILQRGRVALSDGQDFGNPGFVRLNYGCPRATLSDALSRIAVAVNGTGLAPGVPE